MFLADNFFHGFENDQVLFHTTRNLHRITIYLACHHKALHWNLFVIILRILSDEIFNLFTKTIKKHMVCHNILYQNSLNTKTKHDINRSLNIPRSPKCTYDPLNKFTSGWTKRMFILELRSGVITLYPQIFIWNIVVDNKISQYVIDKHITCIIA